MAGPPFTTDDPEPAEYQYHEVYLAFQQTRTATGSQGTLPQFEFNYSEQDHLLFSAGKGLGNTSLTNRLHPRSAINGLGSV